MKQYTALYALSLIISLHFSQTARADDEPVQPVSLNRDADVGVWGSILSNTQLAEALLIQRHPLLTNELRALAATLKPATDDELTTALVQLQKSVSKLNEFLEGWSSGAGWRKYLRLAELLEASSDPNSGGRTAAHLKFQTVLGKFDKTASQPKYEKALRKSTFAQVHKDLKRYVTLLGRGDAENRETIVRRIETLLGAVEAIEKQYTPESARIIRDTAEAMCASAAAEQVAVGEAIRRAFLAPNVRVTVSSGMLQKFASEVREEQGPVRESLAGARIVGTQTTRTTPHIELDPSSEMGAFYFVLEGTSRSNTTAYKGPAQIYGRSYSRFVARKLVKVTPEGLLSETAKVDVQETNNEITGADVDVGGLFAGIARNTAISRAQARRGEAEALAATRVRQRVGKRLNEEVDAAMARINKFWRAAWDGLIIANDLAPARLASTATAQQLLVEADVIFPGQLAAGTAPGHPDDALASVQIHQSAVNNVLDRLALAGKTIEAKAFQSRIRDIVGQIVPTQSAGSVGDQAADLQGSITFAQQEPLRVHFSDGAIRFIVRAESFQNGPLTTSGKIVEVKYEPALADGRLTLARAGEIDVRSAENATNVATTAFAGLLAAKEVAEMATLRMRLGQLFRSGLQVQRDFTVTTQRGQRVNLQVSHLQSDGGWLTVAIR